MTKRADGYMRESMPEVAAWLDQLFDAFGREAIVKQIQRGMKGARVFHASENGHELGTPIHVEQANLLVWDEYRFVRPEALKGGPHGR